MIYNMTPNSFVCVRTIQTFCGKLKTFAASFNATQRRAGALTQVSNTPPPPPPPPYPTLSLIFSKVFAAMIVAASVCFANNAQAQSCAADEFRDGNECVKTCPTGKVTSERRCVTPKEKCTEMGWEAVDFNNSCVVGVWNVEGRDTDAGCAYVSGGQCYDAFGPNLEFPQRPADGSSPRYLYNCDPDGTRGLIPATINTIGLTESRECECALSSHTRQGAFSIADDVTVDGYSPLVGGQCVFLGLRMRLRLFLEGPLR